MQSVIVLDGDLKSALAIVRSLGEKGIPLVVGAERETGMALHSRYVKTRFVYPSPYTDVEGFVSAVVREARNMHDKPVIFACSDATFLALYDVRERLGEVATLVFPDPRAMEMAFDKASTYSLARVMGIPTITTELPTHAEDVRRIAERLTYPAVVKPRRSVTVHDGVRLFGSAHFVHSVNELVSHVEAHTQKYGEAPLIQERVLGEEYGVETIVQGGKSTRIVVHHRIRSLSPTGGASVVKETVEKGALRDMLVTYAERLMYELTWVGPIMVEFKVDSDTKTPRLMEVNGRFWGSLPLSVRAGADMPFLYYELATKGTVHSEKGEVQTGVVTRHFWGDVQHLLRVFFSRDRMRGHVYPKRTHALREFFKLPKGTSGDVWSLRDPKPAVMEILDIWQRRTSKKS
jgi:predicted ATP-grasp superfamily ATP-dependent carboligase